MITLGKGEQKWYLLWFHNMRVVVIEPKIGTRSIRSIDSIVLQTMNCNLIHQISFILPKDSPHEHLRRRGTFKRNNSSQSLQQDFTAIACIFLISPSLKHNSKRTSSWIWRTIFGRAPSSHDWRFSDSWIMAVFIKSAADPCMTVLIACLSAWLRLPLSSDIISLRYRRRPAIVKTYPSLLADCFVSSIQDLTLRKRRKKSFMVCCAAALDMESFFATWLGDIPYSRARSLIGTPWRDAGYDNVSKRLRKRKACIDRRKLTQSYLLELLNRIKSLSNEDVTLSHDDLSIWLSDTLLELTALSSEVIDSAGLLRIRLAICL